MCTLGGDAKIRIDILVDLSTGIIGSFFMYRDTEDIESQVCLPEVFMGALYWFFYGTAFVIGILEIISGQLETDVVRFMGVSVKTFVLTLGTTVGMKIILNDSLKAWYLTNSCFQMELQRDIFTLGISHYTSYIIGILEIISGQLETGVVHFMGVSLKICVLTLGTTVGMKIILDNSLKAWHATDSCF